MLPGPITNFYTQTIMNHIVRLHPFVLVSILTEWIEIDELAMLDTALCNECLRRSFLSLLMDSHFVHSTNTRQCSINYFEWLGVRGIGVASLNLLKYAKKRLDHTILNILQRMNRIKRIEMAYCNNLKFIIEMNGNVEELCLWNSDEMCEEKLFA